MKSSETFKKVFAYIKKYHFFLLLSFVLSIVAVVTQLYIPKCFGKEIDFLLGKGYVYFLSFKSFFTSVHIRCMPSFSDFTFSNISG